MANNSRDLLSDDDRDIFIAQQILKRENKGFYMLKMYALDNFSAFQIEMNDKIYPTAEHLYQASKFMPASTDVAEQIQKSRSPYEAKIIAHMPENAPLVRKDWEQVKCDIMRQICILKMQQHPYIKDKLSESGNTPLAEFSKSDSYWGIGEDGNGKNMLDKIWKSIRAELE